jgi:hypothetical protein
MRLTKTQPVLIIHGLVPLINGIPTTSKVVISVLSLLGECELGEFFAEKPLVGESVSDEYLFCRIFFCPNLFMSECIFVE